MSFRKISAAAIAGLVTIALVAPALSQDMLHGDDAIAKRKELMKTNGMTLRSLNSATPEQAVPLAQTLVDDFAQLADLFPEDSQTGDTHALPVIWSDPDGFMAAYNNAATAAAALLAAAQSGDANAIGAAVKSMGAACGNCHTTYRAPLK